MVSIWAWETSDQGALFIVGAFKALGPSPCIKGISVLYFLFCDTEGHWTNNRNKDRAGIGVRGGEITNRRVLFIEQCLEKCKHCLLFTVVKMQAGEL